MQGSKKNVIVGLVLSVLLIITGAIVFVILQNDTTTTDTGAQKDNGSIQDTNEDQKTIDPGNIRVAYEETISTESDFEEYLSEQLEPSDIVHSDVAINWSQQKVIVTEFYLPSGTLFDSIRYEGREKQPVVSAIAPPEGCLNLAVQVKHVAFMALNITDEVPNSAIADYTVQDSQEVCPIVE